MRNLQEIFDRIQDSRREQRTIRASYREALANSKHYQDTVDKLTMLKETKKKIEISVKDTFRSEFNKLDRLKKDIEADNEMLSDIVLNKLVKGDKVSVTDDYENQYEPIFSVRFKKL